MDKLIVTGGRRLKGEIQIGGAKNAALPLMAATLLTAEPLILDNVPLLADIRTMSELLAGHGARIARENRALTLHTPAIASTLAPYDIVRKMRASILVLGPLVARTGEATVSLPGGCAIGVRPIDLHLKALAQMGADIELADGYVKATAPKGLQGATIRFPTVTVTGTENILMAAVLANGDSVLENAAMEPEVSDLAECLAAMGAKIEGIGTDVLRVTGVPTLHGARHTVVADRIEAGSFAAAAIMTGGDLELIGARADGMGAVIQAMTETGAYITETPRGLRVARGGGGIAPVNIITQPFPGFPTDMQAQFVAMMARCYSAAMVTETIFENRFQHVPELCRMGADITVHGGSAMIRGVKDLRGAPVMATDLRASMSLVLAGLVAQGETTVNRVYHLDRGYETLETKLNAVGADIRRVKEEG